MPSSESQPQKRHGVETKPTKDKRRKTSTTNVSVVTAATDLVCRANLDDTAEAPEGTTKTMGQYDETATMQQELDQANDHTDTRQSRPATPRSIAESVAAVLAAHGIGDHGTYARSLGETTTAEPESKPEVFLVHT